MPNEEAVHRVEELVGLGDYDNAFSLADSLTEEPWRSSAFELLVGLFISPGFIDRFGNVAIMEAYLMTNNDIIDPCARTKTFLAIANVASENQDWETVMKASRKALFEVFYN